MNDGTDELPGPVGALADVIGYLLPLEQKDRLRVLLAVQSFFETGPELPPTREGSEKA